MGNYRLFYDFYDEMYNPLSKRGEERKVKTMELLKKFSNVKQGKAFDVCCGMGVTTFALSELGYESTGIDNREDFIKRAKEATKKVSYKTRFLVMDAEKLKFEDNSFNLLTYLGNPLPHFSIDIFDNSVKEAARVLKKDGEIFIQDIDWISILFSSYRRTLVEHNPAGDVMISYHLELDTEKGFIKRLFHIPKLGKYFEDEFYLWSPWLVEFILKRNGFNNIENVNLGDDHWITKGRK